MRKGLVIFLLLLSVFVLSSCGKMSAPEPYEGSGYPHFYPKR